MASTRSSSIIATRAQTILLASALCLPASATTWQAVQASLTKLQQAFGLTP